jgi:hypothetical protein
VDQAGRESGSDILLPQGTGLVDRSGSPLVLTLTVPANPDSESDTRDIAMDMIRNAVCFAARLVVLTILLGTNVSAGELADLQISETDGIYRVKMDMLVDAPADQVYRVLTDFRHIYRLNRAITESEMLPSDIPGITRVRTLIEDCILLHCVKISRVEEIREGAPGHLYVTTDPHSSDFKSGNTHWRIESAGKRTRVIYESSMEPDFFLPPVVGRLIMKRGLREGIVESFTNLERIARLDAEGAARSQTAYNTPSN